MKITIREAKPQDSRFLAWVILSAGRSGRPVGFWDVYLGKNEEQILNFIEKLTILPLESLCHYSKFLIAQVDNQPAAALACLYPKNATGEVFKQAVNEVFKIENWSEDEIYGAKTRAIPHFTCFPTLPDDAWVLEWVACLPEYRRKGLTDALLKEALKRGEENHAKLFQICVATGNIPAENAYFKAGFKLVDQKTHPEFERIFTYKGLSRLVIDKR